MCERGLGLLVPEPLQAEVRAALKSAL
jgi:hypothetical protein